MSEHLGFEKHERNISNNARGMTTREISAHLEEIYGVEVSPMFSSKATDSLKAEVYTTDSIEALNALLRKNTRNRKVFTNLDSLL